MTHIGRARVLAVLVGVCAFLVFAGTASHDKVSVDVMTADFSAWTITSTGSPQIDDAHLLDGYRLRDQFVRQTPSGHEVVGRAPGVVAAALPAYWLWHPDAMSVVPGAVTAALLIAVALSLLFLVLARQLPHRTALGATIGFGFATPVWSIAANGMWPHTLTVVGILGMAWAARSERWWMVGLFGGVAIWGRLHVGVIVAVLGVLVALGRRDARICQRVAATSGASVLVLCGWNRWVYGSWDPTAAYDTHQFSQYVGDRGLSVVNQIGFWVSPDRGLLAWTPALLVLAPAMMRTWRDLPDWSRALVWGGLVYTVMQGFLDGFTGGAAFYGSRLTLEMLACLAPAVLMSIPAMTRPERLALGPVLAVQLWAVAMGAVVDSIFLPATSAWTDNAFVHAVAHVGVLGWSLLVLVAALGFWASCLWVGTSDPAAAFDVAGRLGASRASVKNAVDTSTYADARGTVSSHSVP
jgi:alpha-1,2-mannosyltransferase